jgi:hypothetical protein
MPGDLEAKIDKFVEHYAATISRQLTSISDAPKPSCCNEKGPNEPQSKIVACNTKRTPHKLNRQMSRVLH